MKQDPTKLQAPDPEKYWQEAEKLLDAHYRQKRRKKRGLLLLAFLCLSSLSYFLIEDQQDQSESRRHTLAEKDNSISESKADSIPFRTADEKIQVASPTAMNKPSGKSIESNESTIAFEKKSRLTMVESNEPLSGATTHTSKKSDTFMKDDTQGSASASTSVKEDQPLKDKDDQGLTQNLSIEPDNNYTLPVSATEVQPRVSHAGNQQSISLLEPRDSRHLSESEAVMRPVTIEMPHLPSTETAGSGFGLAGSVYLLAHSVSKELSAAKESEYLIRRENEEKRLIAPGIGIRLDFIKKNFSFGVGAEYSSLGEKTNYDSYRNTTVNTYRGEWQTYLRTIVDTDTAYISGLRYFLETQINKLDSNYTTYIDSSKVKVTDPTISERNGNVRFSYIEIPLILAYSIPVKRFSLGLSMGISPAWLTAEKGFYLRSDQSGVIDVSELKPLKTFILNARAGLNLGYQLNPRMNVFIGPHMKKNLGIISNSSQEVKQRYTTAGINAGLVYRFR